mgnify:FL=1
MFRDQFHTAQLPHQLLSLPLQTATFMDKAHNPAVDHHHQAAHRAAHQAAHQAAHHLKHH